MAVKTNADEKIDQAKEHIEFAYQAISEAMDENTWGADEYNEEYITTLEDVFIQLRRLKREL